VSAATVSGAILGATTAALPSAAAVEATPVYPSTATVALGDVSGSVKLDLAKGATFTCTIVGNTVFTFINWPAGAVSTEPTVISTQDETGHTISFTGVTWLPGGTVPLFQTGAGQVDINCFVSDDNGTTVYGQGGDSAGGGFGVYGDGSDGAAVLDGTNTYPFLGKSNGYYWLTRDVYLSSLAVAPGITLQLAGGATATFRLFCSGTVSIAAGGKIVTYINTNSVGPTGGSNLTTGSLKPGATGPGGGTGAGTAGTSVLGQSDLSAGKGGAAKSGATVGGAAGVSDLTLGCNSLPRALPWAATMAAYGPNVTGTTQFFPGGASGGAGAGDGTNKGGAGGVGGNPLFIAARNLINNGSVIAYGGAGGAATTGDAGGGGGGQGGPVMLIHGAYAGSGTLASSGGAGGARSGTGAAGAAGGPSWIIRLAN
jgi:hypothetical protein